MGLNPVGVLKGKTLGPQFPPLNFVVNELVKKHPPRAMALGGCFARTEINEYETFSATAQHGCDGHDGPSPSLKPIPCDGGGGTSGRS
jgi:hypothetical protein